MDPAERVQDFVVLIQGLAAMLEAGRGRQVEEAIWLAGGLARKMAFHAESVLALRTGRPSVMVANPVVDAVSMNVVARAAVENYLVFHHLFRHGTPELQAFRRDCYKYCGLKDRIAWLPNAMSDEARKSIAEDEREAETIWQRITAHPAYAGMGRNRQRLEDGGEWRYTGWTQIARDAGFSEINARTLYRMLCGHAHSGYLSVEGLSAARQDTMHVLLSAPFTNAVMALAKFILELAEVDPAVLPGLNEDIKTVAEFWADVAGMDASAS